MDNYSPTPSIKGERSMSQGFIAQYAAEAAGQVQGVAELDKGVIVSLKEAIGGEHEGRGVKVSFDHQNQDFVHITVYPVVYYGQVLPEIAWQIQERIKEDVERFTGLVVEAVDVQITGIMEEEDKK